MRRQGTGLQGSDDSLERCRVHLIAVDVHSKHLARIATRKITNCVAIKSKNAALRRSNVMKRMIVVSERISTREIRFRETHVHTSETMRSGMKRLDETAECAFRCFGMCLGRMWSIAFGRKRNAGCRHGEFRRSVPDIMMALHVERLGGSSCHPPELAALPVSAGVNGRGGRQ